MSEKFTIVLTSFNCIKTIEFVIGGICHLAPSPDQVIIIDDASNDGSIEKIKSLIFNLPKFELVLNKENHGQSYSRNLGVEMSKNDLIIFQDDDDISFVQRSEEHLKAFTRGADFSYVSSQKTYPNGYVVFNKNSNFISEPKLSNGIIQHLVIGKNLPLGVSISAPSCTLAVRKSAFKLLGGFDLELRRLEDIDLVCRALVSGFIISWSSKILVNRMHTIGDDKTPSHNHFGELKVIKSNKKFFSRKDYFVAIKMAKYRSHYFERHYSELLKASFFLPVLFLIAPIKLLSIAKRIRHDLRQGNFK
jgi:glycosyltransferase involved in cell wall biosynthesis